MTTFAQRIKRSPLAHDAQLVKLARSVGRKENRVRRITKELKEAKKELRAERRTLKAYAQSLSELRDPSTPGFRMYGEAQS